MTATLTRLPVAPAPDASPAVPPVHLTESEDLREFRAGLVRFTGADLRKMWEAGILYEDSTIELLDGLLVYRDCGGGQGGRPGMAGADHDAAIGTLTDLVPRIATPSAYMRVQVTLQLSETYNPIPDALVIRGRPADYSGRQPSAVDVWSVIEVADSSYPRDSGEKLAAYAVAGVPQYVIIDLRRRLAEVYADPHPAAGTYPPPLIVPADGSLELRVGEGETVAVPLVELLP